MGNFQIKNMDLYYSDFHALKDINLNIPSAEITAFIGPSGCGKSTLLKSLNRMNDLVEGCKITGEITLDGENIYKGMDVNTLRKRVGMVFQKPNPFPMSIYDNIAYGPRTHGIKKKSELDEIVERSLKQAAIWDEVKDRLKKSALGMSGGQQQRLCIARALLKKPKIIILDDSTSAVDTATEARIREAFATSLAGTTKIIIAQRISSVRECDNIIVFGDGEIVGEGTHDELMRRGGEYAKLFAVQSKYYREGGREYENENRE